MQDSTKLEVEGGELLIKSSKGIMAVIPKDRVDYVKDLIERKNFAAVDKYVQGLAVLKRGDKAEDGGVIQDPPKDWNKFQQFNLSLPNNLRDDSFQYGDKNKYDLYGMWQASGKPESFDQVKDTELFPKQDDGTYHGFSVGDEGVWLKPKSHPTAFMEYSSTQLDPSMKHMRVIQREDGRLQYVPKTPFLDVVASYKKSMESPTYKQRLARELYGDAPADMAEVEKNLQNRMQLLKTLRTDKTSTDDVGEYFPETHSITYNPREARKYGDEETVLAHEAAHAIDTERLDAFTDKQSAFTKKKKEILGEPNKDFYYENRDKYSKLDNEGFGQVIDKITSDIKSGKIKINDKEAFDQAMSDKSNYSKGSTQKIANILSATNASNKYLDEIDSSEGQKKINEEQKFYKELDFKDYLMRDTEVKAKINALRIKANLQHGYNFDEPFDISKYPTLKGDINYQQLNKDLKIPDEAINKLSEYVAYEKPSGETKQVAKNGLVIFNGNLKRKKYKAEDGIVIPPPTIGEPPVKSIAPAESTGNIAGSLARVNFRIAQRNAEKERLYEEAIKDKTGVAEEAFVARYNTSPHRYKYDSDPQYRKEVDKRAEETSKKFGSIDLPATDVNSRNYAGNPNLAFMTQKGMSKEGRKALEQSNLEIIGAALPVPGIETVGKLPSLARIGGKLIQERRAKPINDLVDNLWGRETTKYKMTKSEDYEKLEDFPEGSPAQMTLEEFKKRINSPEGKRRMQNLGINEDDILQNLKVKQDIATHGQYVSNVDEEGVRKGYVGITPRSPFPKTITRHEIEHAVQAAYRAGKNLPNDEPWKLLTSIDKSLDNLQLKEGEELKATKIGRISNLGQMTPGISPDVEIIERLADPTRAYGYFISGSGGREKSAMLAELQEHMVNTGIIKNAYDKITIDDVKKAYKLNEGNYEDRNVLRILNIMQPTSYNFALIRDNLNRMLSITGAAGTGAAASQSIKQNEK